MDWASMKYLMENEDKMVIFSIKKNLYWELSYSELALVFRIII